jgi:hypothetical protein
VPDEDDRAVDAELVEHDGELVGGHAVWDRLGRVRARVDLWGSL